MFQSDLKLEAIEYPSDQTNLELLTRFKHFQALNPINADIV